MARVTVEDCVEKVPNRFELVMLAAKRSRGLSNGQPETVEKERDKNPVIALREIAAQTLPLGDLREELIVDLQKLSEPEEPEDESLNEEVVLAVSRAEMEEAGGVLSAPAEAAGADEGIEDESVTLADGVDAEGEADTDQEAAGDKEAKESGASGSEPEAQFADENMIDEEEVDEEEAGGSKEIAMPENLDDAFDALDEDGNKTPSGAG